MHVAHQQTTRALLIAASITHLRSVGNFPTVVAVDKAQRRNAGRQAGTEESVEGIQEGEEIGEEIKQRSFQGRSQKASEDRD